jgi:hypothetical protein
LDDEAPRMTEYLIIIEKAESQTSGGAPRSRAGGVFKIIISV